MKTVKATSFFKKVSAAQAEKSPALAAKVGQKRADISWSFEAPEVADLASLKPEHVEYFLAKAIEDFGRTLVAQNGADWDFIPSSESLTLAAAFDFYNQESSRKRTLTKQTALAFGQLYARFAPELIQVTPAAAAMLGTTVCPAYMTYSTDEKIRPTALARLEQFAAAVLDLEEDSPVMAELADHVEVLMALIKAFEVKEVAEISADAL